MVDQKLLSVLLFFLLSLFISDAKIIFWTNTYPPFSDCSRYTEGSNSSAIMGAEIELMRSSLASLNWTEGIDYSFDCTSSDFTTLLNTINAEDNNEVGLIGGITMTSQRTRENFRFCQPTVSYPIRLVYRQHKKSGWFFTRSLDQSTWLCLLVTLFLNGGLLYFLEDRHVAYINMLYNVLCQFFLFVDYPLSKISSKIIYYFSTFMVLIIVTTYTAASTNIFQNDQAYQNTLHLEKLKNNQVVYANGVFQTYLDQLGIPFASADVFDPADFINQIDKLDIDFTLVDGPYSDFVVSQHCELYTSTREIDLIHYGIMFHKQFPRDLQTMISVGISNAKQTKDFISYIDDYYDKRNDFNFCTNKVEQKDGVVSLYQMRGPWYVIACGVGISIVFLLWHCLIRLLKRNMKIYYLEGVRARIDGKIQRRVSSLFAIHVSLSLQSIGFLKKLYQKSLEDYLKNLKADLSSLKRHRKIKKIINSHNKIGYLKRDPRKSTLLTQSSVAFRINNRLHLKLENLKAKDNQNKGKPINCRDNSLESTLELHEKGVKSKAKNLVARAFGKKGLKKDKKINKIASILLAEKEASLDLELSKKRSELILRTNSHNTFPKTRISQEDNNKMDAFHKLESSHNIQKVYNRYQMHAPSSIFKDFLNTNSKNELKTSHHTTDTGNKNTLEVLPGLVLTSFSSIHKHICQEEDYNYEVQNENFNNKDGLILDKLDAHDLSRIINSPSHTIVRDATPKQ